VEKEMLPEKITHSIKKVLDIIGRPVNVMEVCGTHTVAIFKHGIRNIIPKEINLLSGPGCPVCVTPLKDVDTAIALSQLDGVILSTFGDMMKVPGSKQSLYHAQAEGAQIRVVYSPMDALKLASEDNGKTIVFFATGFETTSPSIAGTLSEAERLGIKRFSLYSAHKLIPPALQALVSSPDVKVDGFLLPGHVSTIIGSKPYRFIASDYRIPSVITGFGATDILQGIMMILNQIAANESEVEIQCKSVVREEGNQKAMSLLHEYFDPCDSHWRGLGVIPQSGLQLKETLKHRDARTLFDIDIPDAQEPKSCLCGQVLRGVKKPTDCMLFGKTCTPEHPVGACMVSTEGSCAAYYRYSPKDMHG
jgi:hydrogenase expression/formation protein HypD